MLILMQLPPVSLRVKFKDLIMKLQEKMASRKFSMAMYILIVATLMMLVPYVLSATILTTKLFLITGTEWVSLVIGVYGIYAGSNVVNKKFAGVNSMPGDGEMP